MRQPYPFQETVIDAGRKQSLIIADACGLGKTLEAIHSAMQGRSKGVWRILVICPLRVVDQWIDEISMEEVAPIHVLQFGLPLDLQSPTPPRGWYVVHYEAARNLAGYLADYLWDYVICDEAHRLKNSETQWTKAIKHIPAVRKLALTGTPMEKGPQDLWSILNWVNPDIWSSKWKFIQKYHQVSKNHWSNFIIGPPKNEDRLAKELGRVMVKRTKQDVAPDLPPRIEQHITLEMGRFQAEIYKAVKDSDDIWVTVEDVSLIIPNVLSMIVRLQQISTLPGLLGFQDTIGSKMEWIADWVKDNPNEPTVIFTRFREVASFLIGFLERRKPALIVGGVRSVPDEWLSEETNILVGTIAAMGEGLNLQRASTAIFVDQEWSTIKMNQAYDRIHRIGIDAPKLLYFLNNEGTVDSLVREALEKKWSENDLVYEAVRQWKEERNGHV
jgi:SNF2 family DNA or RNA helicase